MTTETTETQKDIDLEAARALARALFAVQKRMADGDQEAPVDEAKFREAKSDLMPVARKLLKVLGKRGFTLTKTGA